MPISFLVSLCHFLLNSSKKTLKYPRRGLESPTWVNMEHMDRALVEKKDKYFFKQHIHLQIEPASKGELSQLFIRSFLCLNQFSSGLQELQIMNPSRHPIFSGEESSPGMCWKSLVQTRQRRKLSLSIPDSERQPYRLDS